MWGCHGIFKGKATESEKLTDHWQYVEDIMTFPHKVCAMAFVKTNSIMSVGQLTIAFGFIYHAKKTALFLHVPFKK